MKEKIEVPKSPSLQYSGDNEKKLILSLCDRTGNWSGPYTDDPAYEVVRIDLLDGQGQDVRLLPYIERPVHGILAAPPCTHFAASGAPWWGRKGDDAILEGLQVVDACLRMVAIYRPAWWALENPVGRLRQWLGAPKAYFHPHEYGGWLAEGERTHPLYPVQDAYTKRTCLWGDGFSIPEKRPVHVPKVPPHVRDDGTKRYTNWENPHDLSFRMKASERSTFRSLTPLGFARAFKEANQ